MVGVRASPDATRTQVFVRLEGLVAFDNDEGTGGSGHATTYQPHVLIARATNARSYLGQYAIAFHRSELFELLADHIDLLQAIYSGLLKAQSRMGGVETVSVV